MNKKDIENVVCPFCEQPIVGKLPNGLTIKELTKRAKEIIKAINNEPKISTK